MLSSELQEHTTSSTALSREAIVGPDTSNDAYTVNDIAPSVPVVGGGLVRSATAPSPDSIPFGDAVMFSKLRSISPLALAALVAAGCSSSTDAISNDVPWARLSGRLAYSRIDCKIACTSSLFIVDARQQKVISVKTLPTWSFSGLAWAPDGKITYAELPSGGGFWELHGLVPEGGNPVTLFSPGGPASWSGDGRAAYQCGDFTLCVDGTSLDLGDLAVMFVRPAWSRDGTRIVAAVASPELDGLVAIDASTHAITLLRQNPPGGSFAYNPLYSPDGTKIVFEVAMGGSAKSEIWVMNADGTSAAQLTTGHADREPAWSPDGSEIAIFRDGNVFVMDAHGGDVAQVTRDGALSIAWEP